MSTGPDRDVHDLAEALAKGLRPLLERSADLRAAALALGRWLVAEASGIDAREAERDAAQAASQFASTDLPHSTASPIEAGLTNQADTKADTQANTKASPTDSASANGAAMATASPAPTSSSRADAPDPPDSPTAPPAASTDDSASKTVTAIQAPAIEDPVTGRRLPPTQGYVPLKIGDSGVHHLHLAGTTEELGRARQAAQPRVGEGSDVGGFDTHDPASEFDAGERLDFQIVEKRCRLKAKSCRHFIRRRAAARGSFEEREATERMNEMIASAKELPQCFLWVFWRERTQPDDANLMAIAENYDALADAAKLMQELGAPDRLEPSVLSQPSLEALAQAHSALRTALQDTWLDRDDQDQYEVHRWLRHWTATKRVFIPRFMSISDPADPSGAPELRARLADISRELEAHRSQSKALHKSLSAIRYHAKRLVEDRDGPAHWPTIGRHLRDLSNLGIPSSDRRISEVLGPEAARLWTPEFAEMVPSSLIGRILASGSGAGASASGSETPRVPKWNDAVRVVRERLSGGHMVIIGGIRKGRSLDRLKEAFDLEDIEWVMIQEHGPAQPMIAPIEAAQTRIVLVIIKLTGHHHADEARRIAAAAGKPCVLLRGGYNPNSVAAAILEQASDRLQAGLVGV